MNFAVLDWLPKSPAFGEATDFTMDVFPLIAPVNVLGFTVYPFLTSKHHIAKQDKPKNENNMWFPYTVWDEPRYPHRIAQTEDSYLCNPSRQHF